MYTTIRHELRHARKAWPGALVDTYVLSGSNIHCDLAKGVGPGPTLAWPGWKQSDISVKVDTARLEAGQFKKCCMECVLLYYLSTEFQSTFNVY
jgi:hypothetical protein